MTERDGTRNLLLIIAIVFISFNLRAPITSLGSLAGLIHDDLGVSNGFIGLITTLPLLAFAFCSPFVFKISGRLGMGTTMTLSIAATILGGILRSFTGVFGLIAGTALIGVGIAMGNVLIPSIIKLRFPNKIGVLTSVYITCQGLFAAIGAGISYPLAEILGFGWKLSLLVWAAVALVALFIWLPQTGGASGRSSFEEKGKETKIEKQLDGNTKGDNLLNSPLAWHLTIFMGAQSLCFYSITAWLPSILMAKGLSPEISGYMAFWYQIVGLPASFAIPILATKIRAKQTRIAISSCAFYFVGVSILAVVQNPFGILVALIFTSTGGGATFSWILAMISLKSKDAQQVARLSGMSQSLGYLLAAMGPTLSGVLFDLSGNWNWTIGFLLLVIVMMLLSGVLVTKTDEL